MASLLCPVGLKAVTQLVDAIDLCLSLLAHFLVAINLHIVQRKQLLRESLYQPRCYLASCVLLLLHDLLCLRSAS